MESLHAPWRIEYILSPKPQLDASLFTRIAQSNDDKANHVVVRDRTCFALLNKYPYNGGHLMVVPYKQAADLNGLTDEELGDLWKLTRRCVNALTADETGWFQYRHQSRQGCRRGRRGPFAHPHRAALEWRHEFHAGAGKHKSSAAGIGRTGRKTSHGTGKVILMASETLHFENARAAQQLFNHEPRNLQSLETELGVKATAREGWIKLEGPADAIERAKQLFVSLEIC